MADNQITPFQLTDQFTMDNFNQRINETNTALQNKVGKEAPLPNENDANNAIENGWYGISSTSNIPIQYGVMRVDKWYSGCIFQTGYEMGKATVVQRRYLENLGWQPWEWVNPPMELGKEYRTTERYLGKPVYVKVVDFGSMPNATTKTLSHGIANIAYPISAYGCTKDGWISIPSVGIENLAGVIAVVSLTNTQIRVWCKDDWTNNECYITIKYTKTTD